MPVRKIPMNYTTLTGDYPSRKVGRMVSYEGTLERDFIVRLESDDSVETYEEQPVEVKYEDKDGEIRSYTPDVLVVFVKSANIRPWLCEIKPKEWLIKDREELIPKFRAATRYAKKKGWRFRIFHEGRIRTDYLWNIKFLMQYIGIKADHGNAVQIMAVMSKLGRSTPFEVLNSISTDKWQQAEFYRFLWCLVLKKHIGADLTKKLNMLSPIWAKGN